MKLSLNKQWKFMKCGTETWGAVEVPHDAMLREQRLPDNPSGSAGAYFSGGTYEYIRDLFVPEEWDSQKLILEFEGVYDTAVVYVNDKVAGKILYGYLGGDIAIEEFVEYGKENQIRVVVENENQPNSRWYSGAGIFRPVTLHVKNQAHIKKNGIKIKTVSIHPAEIEVKINHVGGNPRVKIFDSDENEIAITNTVTTECILIHIPEAKLWTADHPYLYTCKVELIENDIVIDEDEAKFGIRELKWSQKGFFVNDEETLLRGGCIHHDNGVLGACAFEEAEWRKVRIMKEQGFNAIRSSHNPCSKAMLDACDALGMYMMDEAWDMWYRHKSKYDYADRFDENYKNDLQQMVEKDYNHPSVIMYSIGNEVSEPVEEKGAGLEKEMIELIHQMDDSRPVVAGYNLMILFNATKGQQMYDGEGGVNGGSLDGEKTPAMPKQMNSTMFNMITMKIGTGMNHSADSDEADKAISPALDCLDIAGYNYASGRYAMEGEKHPNRVIFGSETFPQDIAKNWEMVKKYPYLIGDFMWTAWDYIGEAGLGTWSDAPDAANFNKPYPWLLGGAGAIDLLGNPGGEVMLARAVWNVSDKPEIAVRPVNMDAEQTLRTAWRGTNSIPSWSWRGCEGRRAQVEVYSNAKEIELWLNDILVGRKETTDCCASFEVEYTAGKLEAVAYDESGNAIGRNELNSATGELTIGITPETEAVAGKLLYVNVELIGENGIVESNADEKIKITVSGGELLGFGSANPRSEESFLSGEYTTWYGRTQAVVHVDSDADTLKIEAESDKAKRSLEVKTM